MTTQMIDRNTNFAILTGVSTVLLAAVIFGPKVFAIATLAALGLAAPTLALWRRSATGVAGPEPSE